MRNRKPGMHNWYIVLRLLPVSTDAVRVHQSTWLKMLKEKPFSQLTAQFVLVNVSAAPETSNFRLVINYLVNCCYCCCCCCCCCWQRSGGLTGLPYTGCAATSAPPYFLVLPLVYPTAGSRHQKCTFVRPRFWHIPRTSVPMCCCCCCSWLISLC